MVPWGIRLNSHTSKGQSETRTQLQKRLPKRGECVLDRGAFLGGRWINSPLPLEGLLEVCVNLKGLCPQSPALKGACPAHHCPCTLATA